MGQEAPAFTYPHWLGWFRVSLPFNRNTLIKSNLLLGGASSFFSCVRLQMLGVSIGPSFHCLVSFGGEWGEGRGEVISYPQIPQYG